jgi:diguanylate cyclase (GGDEF)-like protein
LGRITWAVYSTAGLVVVLAAPFLPQTAQMACYTVVALSAVGAVLTGIRMHRPRRALAWWIILGALCCAVVANLGWAVLAAAGIPVPDFSPLDVCFYAMYPLFMVALSILPRHTGFATALAGLTEAGIVTCAGATVWWTTVVDPLVIHAGRLPSDPDFLAYPVLDVLLVATAVRMAVVSGTRARAFLLMLASAVSMAAGDTAFFVWVARGGDMAGPQVSTLLWLLATVLVGTAALHPSMAAVAASPASEAAGLERPVALPLYLALALTTPVVAGVFIMIKRDAGTLAADDIVLPLAGTVVTTALLVVRLRQIALLSRRRATHDVLTGLPNRALLQQRIAAASARGAGGALIVLYLDGFKEVNERFGHVTGDALLVQVAARIGERTAGTALLARVGADEFAILCEDMPDSRAVALGETILGDMRHPVHVHGHQLYATASAGLRPLGPLVAEADVYRDADLALYAAKAAGRDRLTRWDEQLREERQRRIRTVERLRAALADDEFVVYYQPLVRLDDEHPVAVEALVRWVTEDGSMVPPDAFIPAAEASGLIVPIGEWVLRQACGDAAEWHRRHGTVVSVNVSPRQLREQDFAGMVEAALRDSGLPPGALILEITEGVLVGEGSETGLAIAHLTALRLLGVRVAVDDFGTGYSSLAYLRDLPIDTLKIDKSFLRESPRTTDQAAFVRAIVEMANSLSLGTVAEGVETAGQVELLRSLGCERGQGFHFARPTPADQITILLEQGPASTQAA